MMRKMDIRKKKAGNISKIKGNQELQEIESMRDIGHNRASRSENIPKQAMANVI